MRIQAPHVATQTVVTVDNNAVHLDFNIHNTSFERSENDLTIIFDNGGSVVISDFFIVEDGAALPRIVLNDGAELSATDFLQSMNPDMDITTAAGPTAASPDGSGTNYVDGSGDLLSGVDRLGDLGTFHWGREIESTQEVFTYSIPKATAQAPGLTPQPPIDNVEEPELTYAYYDARAVLYKNHPGTSDTMSIDILGVDHKPSANPGNVTVELADPDAKEFFSWTIVNGKLELTLTQAGQAALKDAAGKNIYSYLTITVDGQEPYTIQVIGNQSGKLSSEYEDSNLKSGGILQEGGLIHGEWHSGNSLNAGSHVTSSNLDDQVLFEGDISGSSLHTGQGIDHIQINGNVSQSTVDSGRDTKDYLDIKGSVSDSIVNGGSTITIGGAVTDSSVAASLDGSGNVSVGGSLTNSSIDSGEGKDIITIGGQLAAKGGDSAIHMGVGPTNELIVSQNLYTQKGNVNISLDGTDKNVINLKEGLLSENETEKISITASGKDSSLFIGYAKDNFWYNFDNRGGKIDIDFSNSVNTYIGTRDKHGYEHSATSIRTGNIDSTLVTGEPTTIITGGSGQNRLYTGFLVTYNGGQTVLDYSNAQSTDIYIKNQINNTNTEPLEQGKLGNTHIIGGHGTSTVYAGYLTAVHGGEVLFDLSRSEQAKISGDSFVANASDNYDVTGTINLWGSSSGQSEFNLSSVNAQRNGYINIVGGTGKSVLTGGGLGGYQGGQLLVDFSKSTNVLVDLSALQASGTVAEGSRATLLGGINADNDITTKHVIASGGTVTVKGGEQADTLKVTGSFGRDNLSIEARNQGHTLIDFTDSNSTLIELKGAMGATGLGSRNEIKGSSSGVDNITMGELYASIGGQNSIDAGGGDDIIHVAGFEATLGQPNHLTLNQVNLGDGLNTVIVDNDMQTLFNNTENSILGGGERDTIKISGSLITKAGGLNNIELEAGNDELVIEGNVRTEVIGTTNHNVDNINGKNAINMGDGNDILKIHGTIEGSVSIDMGADNDELHLFGSAFSGDTLLIDGGAGTDSLFYHFSGAGMGGLESLANVMNENKVINFENLFIDMQNETADAMDLTGLLASLQKTNGDTGNSIYINGDAADSVTLDTGWTLSTNYHVDGYNAYTNGEDVLYIQQEILNITS